MSTGRDQSNPAPVGSATAPPPSEVEPSTDAREPGVCAPLSFAQQRLWFLEQLDDLGSAYHLSRSIRLPGSLDVDALARALDGVVARHDALRTTFHEIDGAPEQRIAPAGTVACPLAVLDLTGQTDAELRRAVAAEVGAPFDLERGPLLRSVLFRLAPDDHLLLLTLHHIVSDGWSLRVLAEDLAALYEGCLRGDADPLPPLPVPYAEYLARQREGRTSDLVQAKKEYWRTVLAGAPPLLDLPTDHPRPARQQFDGDSVPVELDEALTGRLKALSERHGTTLFRTLLAAWAVVAGRLSGQDDVVVGVPMANRDPGDADRLIGFFVDTVVVRIDLSGNPTVGALLERVARRTREARQHQDVPFEDVVNAVAPARSLSYHPIYQTALSWHNVAQARLSLPGLRPAALEEPPLQSVALDTSLVLYEEDGRVAGRLEYARALFERETAERFVGYLRRVLEGMASDEGRRVDRLALMPERERVRVVEEWNRAEAAYPAESCLHELFEARVERMPDAAALVCGGEHLTYAGLNAAANRLARRLRAAGVGPERCVGVMLERSTELVVGVLAVLKAGGVYLPLDPALPAARRAALLADADAAVLVTRDLVLDGFTGPIVSPADAAGEDGSDLGVQVPPGALAYVIYTSGSTGTPKGVGVAHAQAAAHCRASASVYALTPLDRVLQFAAAGFDVSLEQMLAPLSAGACVVLRGSEIPTPLELARQVAEQRLTVINPPTAYWHQLVADAAAVELLARSVRLVIAGGEAMNAAAAREWGASPAAGVRLLNGYGPTETVVTCTAYDVPPALPEGAVHVPVGRPLPGRTAYVLDGRMRPA
ncbi:MAG TPA: condensation domain-containing protein, partial [Longimicrobium sp.]|nr:condensation domain-containing protein [Longimicrobium sp.]